jgi:membrane protein YqaA with SNARE-associated domain
MLDLVGLFTAALVAATLVPAQSEALLAALVVLERHPVWVLLTVATVGNVLGSVVNWALGRFLMRFADHPRFPFRREQIDRAQARYARWGWVSLFFAWVPVIGDPLTLAAGLMRERLWRFVLVVGFGKFARYTAVVAAVQAGM